MRLVETDRRAPARRPTPAAPAPRPGRAATRSGGPIQRMVVYAGAIETMDATIAADLAVQHRVAGGAMLTLDQLLAAEKGTHAIRRGEPVIVVGHGRPGRVESHRAETIARALLKIDNIDQASFVWYTSCSAAVDQVSQPETSVVDITRWVLGEANLPTRVVGAPGLPLHDRRQITGDLQTCAFPETAARATAIGGVLAALARLHDLGTARGFTSLDEADAFGNLQLGDPHGGTRYRDYLDHLIQVLSGEPRSLSATIAQLDGALHGLRATPPVMTDWVRDWYRHDADQHRSTQDVSDIRPTRLVDRPAAARNAGPACTEVAARRRAAQPPRDDAWCRCARVAIRTVRRYLLDLQRSGGTLIARTEHDRRLVARDDRGTTATTACALAIEAAASALGSTSP